MLNKKYMQYEDYFVIYDEGHRLKNSTRGLAEKLDIILQKLQVDSLY